MYGPTQKELNGCAFLFTLIITIIAIALWELITFLARHVQIGWS
jgi:hypothetical protein